MTSVGSRVIVLGSGTSTGVPVIGCDCDVCTSSEEVNKRTRASILLLRKDKAPILIDTPPETRLQLLKAGVKELKHVIYTHTHADHCHGFDDLRAFLFRDRSPVQCYLAKQHAKELQARFTYAFEDSGYPGIVPAVDLHPFDQGSRIHVDGTEIETIALPHGAVQTSAFRIGSFAYATDFKVFSKENIERWQGKIKVMVASGVHWRTHKTHSVIPETVELMRKLGVEHGYISHLSHEVDAIRDQDRLPSHIRFSYDGLSIAADLDADLDAA